MLSSDAVGIILPEAHFWLQQESFQGDSLPGAQPPKQDKNSLHNVPDEQSSNAHLQSPQAGQAAPPCWTAPAGGCPLPTDRGGAAWSLWATPGALRGARLGVRWLPTPHCASQHRAHFPTRCCKSTEQTGTHLLQLDDLVIHVLLLSVDRGPRNVTWRNTHSLFKDDRKGRRHRGCALTKTWKLIQLPVRKKQAEKGQKQFNVFSPTTTLSTKGRNGSDVEKGSRPAARTRAGLQEKGFKRASRGAAMCVGFKQPTKPTAPRAGDNTRPDV